MMSTATSPRYHMRISLVPADNLKSGKAVNDAVTQTIAHYPGSPAEFKAKPKKEKAPKGLTLPKSITPPPARDASIDPDSMYKGGFLAGVYDERPVGRNGVDKAVTCFPLDPNGFLHSGHSKA